MALGSPPTAFPPPYYSSMAERAVIEGLLQELESRGSLDHNVISAVSASVARAHHLSTSISLSSVYAALTPEEKLLLGGWLTKKPIRSNSGVQVVAVMCKPHRCPHQVRTGSSCRYCGGGPDSDFAYSTQSYTGFEPTSMRAIRARYDPAEQVRVRMEQLSSLGHSSNKIEVVLMGGTFLSTPREYRERFIAGIYTGLTGHQPVNPNTAVPESISYASRSPVKCSALTIETRPDFCEPRHIASMLMYGTTRLEVGVQSVYPDVLADVNRGHTLRSVQRCFGQSKDAGFKMVAHMMPNLVFTGFRREIWGFRELFESCRLRPDGLKLYPTLVIRGTGLYERWRLGKYVRYVPTERTVQLLALVHAISPPWLRIYRIMRDIPLPLVTSGVESSNLRESALIRLAQMKLVSQEVRQREVGVGVDYEEQDREGMERDSEHVEVLRRDYWANGGWETFLSVETPGHAMQRPEKSVLHALLRLRRVPRGGSAQNLGLRPELRGAVSLVREVHVYGSALSVNRRGQAQHQGYGRTLVAEAERIAREEHRSRKLAIIAGVGTREYYQKLGYSLDGPYMSRML